MGQQTAPDLVGARDSLTDLRGRTVDEDRGEFLLDIEYSLGQYITGSETNSQQPLDDRRSHNYDLEQVFDLVEAERENPRYERGVPYLLEALHGLNRYQGWDEDVRDPELGAELEETYPMRSQ